MERSLDRRLRVLFGSFAFALLFVACGGSNDVTGGGGSAGSAGSAGSGGSVGSGGSIGPGSAGTSGSAGTAGTGGANGGAGGMAGVGGGGGTAGRGGTTGAGGASGRGGASGSGGAAGSGGGGGRGGASGAGGRGGASGAGGGAGVGGASGGGGAGRGGSSGTTGAGGAAGSSSVDGGNWDAPAIGSMVTVHVAGDSTAAIFPPTDATMRVGWAAVLDPLFDGTVTVDDAALSGRSTKSYIDEGAWTTLQAKIKPGDYLIIEFGHNDEKTDDPTRYTDPATTYRTNLKIFIDGARAKGGFPILATSICRRQFSGNTVTGTHGAYTTAVFAVGQQTNTPVLDMESRTKAWLMALGPTASVAKFAMDDNTHLNMTGAVEVAKLAVAGIRDLGLPLASRALP